MPAVDSHMDDQPDGGQIDNETLQARINLSMSLIDDMVSSWVKAPSTANASRMDSEKELQEYMRRPPRSVCRALLCVRALTGDAVWESEPLYLLHPA